MNRDLIERYAAGASQPAEAIAGLSRDELNAFPVPGTWSIQQIVIHLMDSDLIGSDRMKRVAAEDRPPTLIGYDESAFACGLFYDQLDPRTACEVFQKNRQLTAEILRRLSDDVMVVAILAFVWLTPPDWLGDPMASGSGPIGWLLDMLK